MWMRCSFGRLRWVKRRRVSIALLLIDWHPLMLRCTRCASSEIALVYVCACMRDVGGFGCGLVLLYSIYYYILYSIFYVLYSIFYVYILYSICVSIFIHVYVFHEQTHTMFILKRIRVNSLCTYLSFMCVV